MYISVSSQTTLNTPANFLVFALYNASAPTVLIESVSPTKPYGDPLQITFTTALTQGLYLIKLWESVDTTPAGTVRNSFTQAVTTSSILVRLPIYLQADIFPAGFVSGTNTWSNPSLVGWDFWLERKGSGTLFPDDTAAAAPDYHKEVLGGFTLLAADDNIQPEEEFIIFFVPQVVEAPAGNASPVFQSRRIITTDTTLTNSDKNKALILQGATSVLNVTMPSLSTVADFDPFYIQSNGGSHINGSIICQGSDKLFFQTAVGSLILGQCEMMRVYKADGVYYVDSDLTGVKGTGEFLYNYGKIELNTIQCAGQLLLRSEYPRLWAFVQSLETGAVTTDTLWNSTFTTIDGITYYTKKCLFSTGDGSTNFRLPLLTNMMLKGVPGGSGRIPASLEIEQGISHIHGTQHARSNATPGGGYIGGSSPIEDFTNDGTGVPRASGGAVISRMGSKNLVDNAGAYSLIRI